MGAGAKLEGQLYSDWKYMLSSVSRMNAFSSVMLGGSLSMVAKVYLIPWMVRTCQMVLLSIPSSFASSWRARRFEHSCL